jgi:hypothetical protein
MSNKVKILASIEAVSQHIKATLCYQYCEYQYEDGTSDFGYRFIWKTTRLLSHRGQARLCPETIVSLMNAAQSLGWGNKECTNLTDLKVELSSAFLASNPVPVVVDPINAKRKAQTLLTQSGMTREEIQAALEISSDTMRGFRSHDTRNLSS